jgi:hypothetical protein
MREIACLIVAKLGKSLYKIPVQNKKKNNVEIYQFLIRIFFLHSDSSSFQIFQWLIVSNDYAKQLVQFP